MAIHIFKVSATVKRSFPLVVWSGTFLASVVKSLMSREELECGFSLSPLQLFSSNGLRVVLSGVGGGNNTGVVLEAGSRVLFRLTSFCRNAPASFLGVLSEGDVGVFSLQSVDYELVNEFPSSRAEEYARFIDVYSRGVVDVFFYPTILVFRGWRILHPSPQRIVFGLVKSAVDLLNVDPRVARKRARVLSRNIELIRNDTKVVSVNIGRNRVVRAFMGRAVFGVYGLENLRDFADLLKFGTFVGLGKSRGISFGFYRYRVVSGGNR